MPDVGERDGMYWTEGLLVPDRLRLRATAGPAGAQAARLLYQQRRYRTLASSATWGRSVALSHRLGRRCASPLDGLDELCALLGVIPVGAAAIHSRGYPIRVADRLVLCIIGDRACVVAKVGTRLDAGLSREAALLGELDGTAGSVIVPRVRWAGAWRERYVLAMDALELADNQRAVSVGDAACTATSLSLGSAKVGPMVHGDLSPWNLLRTPSGLALIDWEGGRTAREPLYDLAHFVVMRGALLRHDIPEHAVALLTSPGSPGWRHLTALDIDPSTAPALLRDYVERTWEHTKDSWEYRKALLRVLSRTAAGRPQPPIGLTSRPESIGEAVTAGGTGGALITTRPTSRAAPLSSAQEPLWYFSRLAPDNPVYNEAVTIRKDGHFDVDACRQAFNELVRRHEILRSTFEGVDGDAVQVVHQAESIELPLLDLSRMSRPDAEREAATILGEDARRPYDLERGPMIRPRIVRFADDDHRLCLAMHHLVFDGFSLRHVVFPELVALYGATLAGERSPLPDTPIQYADYAIGERADGDHTGGPNRMEYWKHRLGDAPTLELPLDHPRPSHQRFSGAMYPIRIEADVADRLRTLCHQTGTNVLQLLASAFAVLLHRYSGQDDIVFATVANQRQRPELQSMVGYCSTPLVLRTDLSADPTFVELLTKVSTDLDAALSNSVPFERLLRELHVKRDPGTNPVYQAMIVVEPSSVASDPLWSLQGMDVAVGNVLGRTKLDLDLELDEHPGGDFSGRLLYNTDLFEPATARRMADHWQTLLDGIAEQPHLHISELPLLSDHEQQLQLVDWNATTAEFPRDSCIHELVAAQVMAHPEAIAIDCAASRLTYLELDRRATQIAHALQAAGAGTGGLVGICLDRTSDMVAGMLGILKSGAAYLPLDPRYPMDRLAFILEDSGTGLILTQRSLVTNLPARDADCICLEDVADALGSQPDMPATTTISADDIAYVLYTSGSTGRPKGVAIRHRSVVNLLTSMAREPGIERTDAVLAITTTSFDMSVPELWLALVSGARMVIAPTEVVVDGRRLGHLIAESGVTFMQATPATWQMLIDSGWSGSPALIALSGGEALNATLADRLLDRCAVLWNAYGPTETTVWSTLAGIKRGDPITVGRPIANTRVYLLDQRARPVPIGVAGEMFIGGDGVAFGYLNRPELSAERFVSDPFVAGGRMYRTGDRARYRADGNIEFLGRLDHQVKIRGFRIEPGEVEAVLLSHFGVAAAVVVAREDSPGSRLLVAYIVPRDAMPPAAELRDLCRQSLPEYMVPATVVALERLPLTSNGKLDRTALPAPERGRDPERTFTPARSALEAQLVRVWARTLGLDRVGVDDDFFELGGHSLLAVRLLVRVEAEFGVAVPLATLVEGSATVARIASAIESAAESAYERQPTAPEQSTDGKPVLFFVQPGEEAMLTMRHFTRALGSDQRVVGLLPPYRHGARFDQSRSIEVLATGILRSIRQTQPTGPYCLVGFSMGGLLAYEIANQLRAGGEEVAWLALLDAAPPAFSRRAMRRRLSVRQRLARQRERGLAGSVRHTRLVVKREMTAALVRLHLRRSRLGDDFDWRGALKLTSRYVCTGNDAPMDLFVTADGVANCQSRSLGWDEIHKGPLRVHDTLGDHLSMVLEPNVTVLSQMLASNLRLAQR
ncbi:MAG: amino acid adenylation domain-containing protein [Solirubrobacteraceae bacterium]